MPSIKKFLGSIPCRTKKKHDKLLIVLNKDPSFTIYKPKKDLRFRRSFFVLFYISAQVISLLNTLANITVFHQLLDLTDKW
jgi:hypothetical protein